MPDLWLSNPGSQLLVDSTGKPMLCADCPCGPTCDDQCGVDLCRCCTTLTACLQRYGWTDGVTTTYVYDDLCRSLVTLTLDQSTCDPGSAMNGIWKGTIDIGGGDTIDVWYSYDLFGPGGTANWYIAGPCSSPGFEYLTSTLLFLCDSGCTFTDSVCNLMVQPVVSERWFYTASFVPPVCTCLFRNVFESNLFNFYLTSNGGVPCSCIRRLLPQTLYFSATGAAATDYAASGTLLFAPDGTPGIVPIGLPLWLPSGDVVDPFGTGKKFRIYSSPYGSDQYCVCDGGNDNKFVFYDYDAMTETLTTVTSVSPFSATWDFGGGSTITVVE